MIFAIILENNISFQFSHTRQLVCFLHQLCSLFAKKEDPFTFQHSRFDIVVRFSEEGDILVMLPVSHTVPLQV